MCVSRIRIVTADARRPPDFCFTERDATFLLCASRLVHTRLDDCTYETLTGVYMHGEHHAPLDNWKN